MGTQRPQPRAERAGTLAHRADTLGSVVLVVEQARALVALLVQG